jgi:predicted amino acid dehydrogenase
VYKAINLGSRFFVNKADAATKEELGRFLTDPDAVRKVNSALKQLDGLDLTDTSARVVKLANDLGGGIAHTLARRGVVVGGVATEQQPDKAQAPMQFNPSDYEVVE